MIYTFVLLKVYDIRTKLQGYCLLLCFRCMFASRWMFSLWQVFFWYIWLNMWLWTAKTIDKSTTLSTRRRINITHALMYHLCYTHMHISTQKCRVKIRPDNTRLTWKYRYDIYELEKRIVQTSCKKRKAEIQNQIISVDTCFGFGFGSKRWSLKY